MNVKMDISIIQKANAILALLKSKIVENAIMMIL